MRKESSEGEQHFRGDRKIVAEALKNLRKPWHHECEKKDHHAHRHAKQHDRISERGHDLAAAGDFLLLKISKLGSDFAELATGFARAKSFGINLGKISRMFCKRGGNGHASSYIGQRFLSDIAERLAFRLFA